MTVRKIREQDLEQLLLLYEYLHEQDLKAPMEELRKVWQQILASDLIHYFVIEMDGILVSSCNLTIIPNLTRGGRPFGLIENVVTHADYRDQGLGRAVLKEAISVALDHYCYKVMLLSSATREDAHKLYESLGFSATGKIGYVLKLV